MRLKSDRDLSPDTQRLKTSKRSWLLLSAAIVALAALVLVTGAAQTGPQQAQTSTVDKNLALPEGAAPVQPAVQVPATSHARKQDAAMAQRKKDLTDESATLLTLAMALKAEVDKTNKDTLSLNVIRKADEIEKLARNVKEQIRKTSGTS